MIRSFTVCITDGKPIASSQSMLGPFPQNQHRPVLLNIGIQMSLIKSRPYLRWNFSKTNWEEYGKRKKNDAQIRWLKPTPDSYTYVQTLFRYDIKQGQKKHTTWSQEKFNYWLEPRDRVAARIFVC